MTQKLQSIKSREVIFTERDEVAFSRILRDRFPTVRFQENARNHSDDILVCNRLQDCPGSRLYIFVPKEDWTPLILNCPPPLSNEFYLHKPRTHFIYYRGHWSWLPPNRKWACEMPNLTAGHVEGAYYREGDNETRLFLNTVWRLITKISVCIGSRWCGYDALRHAQERPRRMLDGCIRPAEDWRFPEDCPYYRDELWDDDASSHPGLDVFGIPWDRLDPSELPSPQTEEEQQYSWYNTKAYTED